jgi:KaiC/GvpD/RAD55 family RecA-like ATPase
MRLKDLLNSNITAILIKGLPGAGKTTLALELLRLYGKGLYVSTRMSEEKLVRQHPYVKTLTREGKFGRIFKFEDLRLGSATEIIKAVINAITENKETMIILDTWDAIAKELEPVERLKAERSIVAMTEANDARIIFVSEEPYLTTVDYLADAIVTLKDEVYEGRRLRRIEWNKLRGTPIPQRSHLFTLNGGRFTMFDKTLVEMPADVKPTWFKPIEHPKGHFSSGSPDIDATLGPFRQGIVLLLEIGKSVNVTTYAPILFSTIFNFMMQGGFSINMPSSAAPPEFIKETVLQHVPKEQAKEGLRIGVFEEPSEPYFFKMSTSSADDLYNTVLNQVNKMNRRQGLFIVAADMIEEILGTDQTMKFFYKLAYMVRKAKNALIITAKHAVKSKEELSDMSDKHAKLEIVDSALIGYIIKPGRPILYHIDYDYSEGFPRVRINPII